MKKIRFDWHVSLLLVIIAIAIFVRTYKFDEFLYFKMDQARDAIMLTNAVENGPQYLPLLGARVGAVKLKHGMLRLGPISYYLQYTSAIIFHSTAAYVYAYPDLLFSILAIPLLYLFVRLYFSKRNSLFIVAMYAFSFIIIQYSRFAWNPNSLQFFLLLSFYGLVQFLNENDDKKRRWWLILWAVGMTIGSQLHFFGFFSLLGISGLLIIFHYKLWKKENVLMHLKKDSLKIFAKWAAIVFVVFAIFYTPVFISDTYKNGQNTKNFFEALSSKPSNKPFGQKIVKSSTENMKYYCLITTSQCYGSSMRKDYPAIILTAIILLAALLLTIKKIKQKNIENIKKDFLMLLIIWIGVFTILTIPVAYQLRPRFFIVVFAIPFIALGLIFEFFEEKFKKNLAFILALIITTGIVGWNLQGTKAWFKEQNDSQKKNLIVKRTLILKTKDGVTLGQLQRVTDWMYARHLKNSTLYYYIKPEHIRPITFLLHQKNDPELVSMPMKINADPNAQYFAITPAKNKLDSFYSKYPKNDITVIAQQQVGQLLVSEISINDRSVSPSFRFNKSSKKDDRIYWKDVFGIKDNENNRNLIPIDGNE